MEWKNIYKALMQPFLTTEVFPEDILQQLNQHFQNLSASICTDFDLMKVLKSNDERKSNFIKLRKKIRKICKNCGKKSAFLDVADELHSFKSHQMIDKP